MDLLSKYFWEKYILILHIMNYTKASINRMVSARKYYINCIIVFMIYCNYNV